MSGSGFLGQARNALAHVAKKAPISLACAITEKYVELKGGSLSDGDASAFGLARWVTMKRGGRAEKYLDHFLAGTGSPVSFTMKELLHEDAGVAARLEMELLRKLPELSERATPGDKVNPVSKVGTERHAWSVDPCVTLFQKNFSNQDWWYAIGTFNVDWKVLQTSKGHHYVKVWGENEYKWHPEENRITQCLHQAGARLHTAGRGKNFMIKAIPCVLVLSETKRKMIEMISLHSFNPNANDGGISVEGIKSRIFN